MMLTASHKPHNGSLKRKSCAINSKHCIFSPKHKSKIAPPPKKKNITEKRHSTVIEYAILEPWSTDLS